MSVKKFNKKVAEQKFIEVEGKKYEVAKRTQRVESEILQWKSDMKNLTDMESFEILFKILLGEEAKNDLLIDGIDSDLDYLDSILNGVLDLYYEDQRKEEQKQLVEKMKQLEPITSKVNTLNTITQLTKDIN